MIINVSRGTTFLACRRKSMYYHRDRLEPWRVADPLILGGSYHKGLATWFATGNVTEAIFVAEADYRARYAEQAAFILPEEHGLIERQLVWLSNSLAEFSRHYAHDEIQVLQPEVEFTVPLPDSLHHCGFFHRILYPDVPIEKCVAVTHPEGREYLRCWQPHYFRGKTDAVVSWQGKCWLFEHKTEARTGDVYFNRYLLDWQPTGYIYGISKSTNLRPQGFLLNIIKKPNAAFKGDPLTVIGFEREAYLRSDLDLERFERELTSIADDMEQATFNPFKVYMNTHACTQWNRKCDFMDVCLAHGHALDGQFRQRPQLDYVEAEYYHILGLPVPEVVPHQPELTEGALQ